MVLDGPIPKNTVSFKMCLFYVIIILWCKNMLIPRRNCGQFGGINSPRAQSSDQFRGARVENQGSYFLRKSAFIISENCPCERVTETPELSQAQIPSHPGIKYRVRTSPHFDNLQSLSSPASLRCTLPTCAICP